MSLFKRETIRHSLHVGCWQVPVGRRGPALGSAQIRLFRRSRPRTLARPGRPLSESVSHRASF
jgi:hypothetical protein